MATAEVPKQTETSAADSAEGKAMIARLRGHIAGSLLPGEAPLDGDPLDEAAQFLFEAAHLRKRGTAALLLRSGTGAQRNLRIAVINKDMPFLVDSIAAVIVSHGLPIDRLVHPVLPVRRDGEGVLTALPDGEGAGERHESMIYIETVRVDAKLRRALEQDLTAAMADVRAAVRDWPLLRAALTDDAGLLADPEGGALLRWLADDRMTLLGHVTRRRDGSRSDTLGICRGNRRALMTDDSYDRAFAWFDGKDGKPGRAPLIIKSNQLSTVHRRIPLDLLIVPRFEDGRVAALSVHAGIWTSAALAAHPDQVPIIRQRLTFIMDKLGVEQQSHDGKALVHALSVLPHDLIIGFSPRDTAHVATALMALTDRPRPRSVVITAPLDRHIFAFAWLPRDMMSVNTRIEIQQLIERETGAVTIDWGLVVEGGALAMLRFMLDNGEGTTSIDSDRIDQALQDMLRGWSDAVENALRDGEEAGRAAALATRYAESFPSTYRTAFGPAEAAQDIARLRGLAAADQHCPLGRDARLYRHASDPENQLRLKIYQQGGAMPLSDAVPALENFGFRVLAEKETELTGSDPDTIHDFHVLLPAGEDPAPLLARADAIEQAIRAVINGLSEDDVFNRLVIGTGLNAEEADWLRAIYRYLRQANVSFTIYTVVDALRGAPNVARALVQLFRTRHDPDFARDRAAAVQDVEEAIRTGLADVAAINDDRLLRLYWACISAMLRTNAFAPAAAEALAFKLDSALVPGLPRPVPWREIFVYSRRVEGIHLRAGPVARGGLRWSDRRDDFRTEILGLMKAQRVKNAVIVPTGAKGGFYPKRLPNPAIDRDAWFEEGRESYKLFIRTLLSLTDNIVGEEVLHPPRVVIHDGADPYFVVAADKGTATFSDTANAIARDLNFWLDDAFASGGSNGYDHKAMGITARGAWISVQRHFREMAIDVQTEPVRVIGCGDMSGDVFGNGMLLSKAIKLVAAFDHRHIFIDPDPDPATSWEERARLFALPRSSWADYSEKLLSSGGGIYPRSLKQIPLSPEARAVLGITDEVLDPESLISAILKSPNDLLWFGGIGTYLRGALESDAQVGDPANDGLRVAAAEVRAKVIGEGANLGVTQAGRIEYALRGGRINTDFIDNSAGVDCSDNEVNIKIALAAARRAGRLSEPRRIALLRDMTDDVAALVLEDNRLQVLALSIAERGGAPAVPSLVRLIEALEDISDFDRKTEGIADSQALTRRATDGHGLTRPELAVLMSNAKLVLQDAIERSDLACDDATVPLLLEKFPPQMRDQQRKYLLSHQLRGELVATAIANRMVNRMGMIHPFELAEEEGAGLDLVAAAFVCAAELLRMERVWTAIDAADMPEEARVALFDHAAQALRGHMADLLRTSGPTRGPSRIIEDVEKGVADLIDHVDDLLAAEARDHSQAIAQQLVTIGAPDDLARMVANLFAVDGAIGLAQLARETGIAAVKLTSGFIDLGERLGLDWAQYKASVMNPSDPWERLLVSGLARDFQQMRFDFLRGMKRNADPMARIAEWAETNATAIHHFRNVITRAKASSPLAPSVLARLAGQARNLLQR